MNTQSSVPTALVCTFMLFFAVKGASGQKRAEAAQLGDGPGANVDFPSQGTLHDADPVPARRSGRYTVHPSDVLALSFVLSPEFDQIVTVQPDGYISLRSVGDLRAAGQTLPQLTESVKTAYSKILHDPLISIDLKDFEKPYFVVGGQVGKPGKFEWRGDVTLTQAIAIAGGLTDAAKHSQVLMFRRISDQWTEAKVINMKKMLNARNLQEDPVLQPGDMLFVPKNALSKIKPFLPTASAGAFYNPANF